MGTLQAELIGNDMDLNFTAELAQLMRFTGETATAIRMYSAYSGGSPSSYLCVPPNPKREQIDLMFLADALHNFNTLGRAIQEGDADRIVCVCDELLSNFALYDTEQPQFGSRQAKPTFDLWKRLVDLDVARGALTGIRDKAAAMLVPA